MIKVSVLIPAYNAEKYIHRCLDNIITSKIKDIEIIITNDESKDNTLKILNEYAKKDKRIRIIDQKNTGQAIARNNMAKIAKGEYLTFIDIDDFPHIDMIEKLYNAALQNNSDYVFCDYIEYNGEDNYKLVKNNIGIRFSPTQNAILSNFAAWAKMYRTKFYQENNFQFMPGKLFEDITILPICNALAEKPTYIPEGLYYYNNVNDSSIRRKKYNQKLEDIFYAIDELYDNALKYNLLEKYKEEFEFIYLDSLLKGGVFRFSDFNEGLKHVVPLRNKIKKMFPNLLQNKYYLNTNNNQRKLIKIAYFYPPIIIYFMKKIKKKMVKN